jgi:hypothetical protein
VPVDNGLTELVDIDPERVDLVKNPANGFPILVMKAVNAQGGVDEKADIAGAESVLQQLARLIQSEAAEMAVGNWEESYDINLLSECVSIMQCFLRHEQWGDEDDGEPVTKDLLESAAGYVIKRKVSAAERKKLASEGNALPDGSYPVENEGDLHNAAILARSGHGDVAAAKRLIAKRAKELGVANPLANDNASKETGVPETKNNTETSPAPEAPEVEAPVEKSAAELLDEAVAKAVNPLQEVIKGLEAEMAVLKSTPIPGGPVVTVPGAQRTTAERAHQAAEAARFRGLAKSVTDQDLVRFYETKAEEAEKAARA